jgi:hypothetical protein
MALEATVEIPAPEKTPGACAIRTTRPAPAGQRAEARKRKPLVRPTRINGLGRVWRSILPTSAPASFTRATARSAR